MKGLKHDPDGTAAKARESVLVEPTQFFACDPDMARIRPLEAGHDHQQGRFPRAGRADETHRLARRDLKRYLLEDMNAGPTCTK